MPYKSPDALLPLTPVAFEILLALAEENLHGYAILQAVESRLGGLLPLRTGTLYRSLARLLEAELIERDLPYYDPAISEDVVSNLNRFAQDVGLLSAPVPYDRVVATRFCHLWNL